MEVLLSDAPVRAPGHEESSASVLAHRQPAGPMGTVPREPLLSRAVNPLDTRAANDVIHELISAHELERRRIARDVHDIVGQALTAVRLQLEQIRRAADLSASEVEARRAITTLDRALREVRDLAFDIRPQIIADLGLVAATRWLAARQARSAGYRATFRHDGKPGAVGVEIEAACFRVAQESLTNIARHAKARRVKVTLSWTVGELALTVEDDGVGFDPRRLRAGRHRRASLGLVGIAERVALVGGSLDVSSRVGFGTTVHARFPVSAMEDRVPW